MKSERFLLDTNIFILLFNDRLVENLPLGEILCSVITEMELLSFPLLTSAEENMIRAKRANLTVYGIDDTVKEQTIRLRRAIRLKLPDAIIAATALTHKAILVTNDKALHMIPELDCRSLELKT